jgi:CspA family cold shock protein
MAKGTVKWFDPKKGFGFVVNEEGKDVFVHYTSIDGEGFRCLRNGQVVEYEQFETGKGLQGKSVQIVEVKAKESAPRQEAKTRARRGD